jgi:hypothetical protein
VILGECPVTLNLGTVEEELASVGVEPSVRDYSRISSEPGSEEEHPPVRRRPWREIDRVVTKLGYIVEHRLLTRRRRRIR